MGDMDLRVPPKANDPSEPHIRLLVCYTCQKVDELPDFKGPAEHDTLLDIALVNHIGHKGRLFSAPLKYWMVPPIKAKILDQISNGSTGLDVVGSKFYESRSTFGEDALKCYRKHNRPKEGCPDFKNKSKELVPPTKADRKELGLSIKDAPKIHLCDFCPVKVYVEHQMRLATKAYE